MKKIENIFELLEDKTISFAESVTGGYLSHLFTSVEGSSKYFKGSIVSYSNASKNTFFGIEENFIYSFKATELMSKGVKDQYESDIAVAVSGHARQYSKNKNINKTYCSVYFKNNIFNKELISDLSNRVDIIKDLSLQALSFLEDVIKNSLIN